ncbi:MAG: serine kinase [Cyanobacteria bacterium P01_H01_bin.15]
MDTASPINLSTATTSGQHPRETFNEDDLKDLQEQLSLGFSRAQQQANNTSSRTYQIGPHKICLNFANAALEPYFTRALSHLDTSNHETPDLSVQIWDNASNQSKLPLLLSSYIDLLRAQWWLHGDSRGELIHFDGTAMRGAFFPYPNRLSVLDLQHNIAYYWIENATKLPYNVVGASLRVILHWWFTQKNWQLVHAGAVGTAAGGMLIVGQGGSGKSTTCLSCLNSKLSYASDDYSLVSLTPEPTVYSLYNTAKLKGQSDINRFPSLAPHIFNSENLETEKATLFVHEANPHQIIREFPLKAILLPRIAGTPSTDFEPVSPGKALQSLSISTIFQLPGAHQGTLRFMSQLIRKVPTFRLNLGTDITQIPSVIEGILTQSQGLD